MATIVYIGKFALIDDSGNELSFYLKLCSLTNFLTQCVKARYNVTEDKILKFRWGNVVWDYAQVVSSEGKNNDAYINGFRMEVQSNYLNPYYQIQSIIADKNELIKHIISVNSKDSTYLCEACFRYILKYKKNSHGYKVTLDIIDKEAGFKRFVEENGRLVASIHY